MVFHIGDRCECVCFNYARVSQQNETTAGNLQYKADMTKQRVINLLATMFVLVAVQLAAGQKNALSIDYTVELTEPQSKQFRIVTEIKNIKQDRLDLSLPTWTPGWYTVENYGKNLLRFRVTDASGKVIRHTMSRKQTWNIPTKGVNAIRVEYFYRADVLALNQAKITDDYAFFTGIQLFMQPEGYRHLPSRLHFKIPQGWRLITPLKNTADPMTFIADNYDTLVDAPAEMGKFDLKEFTVDDKPHYFVANPAGTFNAEKTEQFVEMLSKVALAQKAMFGDLPYDKYVYYYFFKPAESNAGGALEHLNSFVAFAPPGDVATPQMLITTAAHEFFHLWNVKRFRPAEMWPYDYSRENETPLLWLSEGFTNYYANVAVYRAGLITPEQFYRRVAGAASGVEGNEARQYISPANASVSTWLGYDSPQAFSISYYTQGQNIAALLDLSIRHDTKGRSGLDDVMRSLYNDFYKKGRGYTTADVLKLIEKLTGKDYDDFFDRYIGGTDVPDYAKIFGYAGLNFETRQTNAPILGFGGRMRAGRIVIQNVDANSPAAAAGLQKGDTLTHIDGASLEQVNFGTLAGKTVKITFERDGKPTEASMAVGSRPVNEYVLSESPNATAEQKAVRDAWMKR